MEPSTSSGQPKESPKESTCCLGKPSVAEHAQIRYISAEDDQLFKRKVQTAWPRFLHMAGWLAGWLPSRCDVQETRRACMTWTLQDRRIGSSDSLSCTSVRVRPQSTEMDAWGLIACWAVGFDNTHSGKNVRQLWASIRKTQPTLSLKTASF